MGCALLGLLAELFPFETQGRLEVGNWDLGRATSPRVTGQPRPQARVSGAGLCPVLGPTRSSLPAPDLEGLFCTPLSPLPPQEGHPNPLCTPSDLARGLPAMGPLLPCCPSPAWLWPACAHLSWGHPAPGGDRAWLGRKSGLCWAWQQWTQTSTTLSQHKLQTVGHAALTIKMENC